MSEFQTFRAAQQRYMSTDVVVPECSSLAVAGPVHFH